ncbi:Aldo/keto reductase (fragment) [Candidatus Sulfopaludibacter sp. SbA4]
MNNAPSRRNFLAAGLTLPAVASATRTAEQSQPQPPARPSTGAALQYRTLGKTGLRVTTVGFGCMITSDPSVITRGVDMGINYFQLLRYLP